MQPACGDIAGQGEEEVEAISFYAYRKLLNYHCANFETREKEHFCVTLFEPYQVFRARCCDCPSGKALLRASSKALKPDGKSRPKGKSISTEKRIFRTEEAGAYLGYSAWSMRELARAGKIPFKREGRRMLFDRKDLDAWNLWHGNVHRALQLMEDLELELDREAPAENEKKLLKAIEEFDSYIKANQSFIPNYGDRYRHGEAISTGFVESTVNQVVSKRFVKKRQMGWTDKRAHQLLQIRTKVLNNEWRETLQNWYPGMNSEPDTMAMAA
jgi:excisionase family DNA binding protein